VDFCHVHNVLDADSVAASRRFGIRVSLPQGDTFSGLLGNDWERVHWYSSERERDRAYDNMAKRHGYYRKTDTPTQILEKIVR
jgi:hypothetical protein